MAIQKVNDSNKLLSRVELRPKRLYTSGSWGVSGSIYVFPNRSETQKDNIDERLNLFPLEDGTDPNWDGSNPPESAIIRPFSGNSLEARRIDIYGGDFNLFDQTLTDALAWEYTFEDNTGTVPAWALANPNEVVPFDETGTDVFLGDDLNDWLEEDYSRIGVGDKAIQSLGDPSVTTTFVWTSNNNWVIEDNNNDNSIYNKLPETDRDKNALNYEVPLSLLLDGADPETQDHAWRKSAVYQVEQNNPLYSLGNSSLTAGNPELFQFTGWNYQMENGFPIETTTITSKDEVNAWPPEIEKWGSNIITNFTVQGYSDLSMHPRNKTQKFIEFDRADYDYFSQSSSKQRMLFRKYKNKGLLEEGWWVKNSQSLSLQSYLDFQSVERVPALAYPDENAQYVIDFSSSEISFNIEFWIKPAEEQTEIGTVVQLDENYAIVIIPDPDYIVNSIPQRFRVSMRVGSAAADGEAILGDLDHRENGGTAGVFISRPLLTVNEWHHVSLRWGRNFNNGLFTMYLNNVPVEEFDGINDGARTGLIQTNVAITTTNKALFVGGYPSDTNSYQNEIWDEYSLNQRGLGWANAESQSGGTITGGGYLTNFSCRFQLKSELTELRCWDYPRTEEIIDREWTSRANTAGSLLYYIPFWFDANHEFFERKPELIPGVATENQSYDPGVDLEEIFYDHAADISNTMEYYHQKTPFCENWGHIAGVPFVNVGSHLKEYIGSSIPVVVGMPDISDKDIRVYPNFDGSSNTVNNQFQKEKISYLQRNWSRINWLRCWNSIMVPCTIQLDTHITKFIDADSATSSVYENGTPIKISYHKPENLSFYESNAVGNTLSGKMFEDEQWRQGTRTEVKDQNTEELLSWSQEPKLTVDGMTNDIDNLAEVIVEEDILPPYSLVISIPVIYYGNRIEPESFCLSTKTESGKDIKIVDRNGVLYVADYLQRPTCAKVGHIDYEFGYLCIFSHLLCNVSLNETSLEFRGSKNLHVLQFDVRCPVGFANESKNNNYQSLRATANSNESESLTTYISTVYLHDENLNIIGKVKLAQPIQKREEDSFLFRIKMDF